MFLGEIKEFYFFGSGRSEQGMIYLEKFAGVAQLVEQLICNQPVGSSSLSTSLLNKNRALDHPECGFWYCQVPLASMGRFSYLMEAVELRTLD
jgi:hypothetical protein